jgi:hypothetical protein
MKAASFLKKNAKKEAKYLQLNAGILHSINSLKLPFTSKNYYAFCDKYLDDDANEALFLDGGEKYFREIATEYDTFRYFHFLGGLYSSKPVFCDIGCGIGNTLHYASKLGFETFGYEINKFLAPIHKKLKADVTYEDILKADLARLATVDLLYLYRPINDSRLMNRLFSLIHKHTGNDLVICYNYPHAKTLKGFDTIGLGPFEDMIILLKHK